MDKIGDAAFRVMCEMWGVEQAIKAVKRMGMKASDEQISAAREKELVAQELWNAVFRQKEEGK